MLAINDWSESPIFFVTLSWAWAASFKLKMCVSSISDFASFNACSKRLIALSKLPVKNVISKVSMKSEIFYYPVELRQFRVFHMQIHTCHQLRSLSQAFWMHCSCHLSIAMSKDHDARKDPLMMIKSFSFIWFFQFHTSIPTYHFQAPISLPSRNIHQRLGTVVDPTKSVRKDCKLQRSPSMYWSHR